ncbi:MAG TPA: PTS sugar transporter subunit IIB [Desulfuromonadales bacterium]|nr:PTS sugar transporter subunit IIB [Desulfuromonadales bacterium]
MSIVLTRIDNRLIHGQVLESWVPFTKANCIVVADDRVAGLPFQRTLMAAAVPRGIRLFIGTTEEVARGFASHEFDSLRVLLLFSSAEDSLIAYRLGVAFTELNLGNMHGGEGKVRLSCTLAFNSKDVETLQALEDEGVKIVAQCFPSDRTQPWKEMALKWKA